MSYHGQRLLSATEVTCYNYTQEELKGLAISLGIDPELERHLFWVAAHELLSAPSWPWGAFIPDSGDGSATDDFGFDKMHFVNMVTGEVREQRPLRQEAIERVKLERSKSMFVPLTLSAEVEEDGKLTVIATGLSGDEVVRVTLLNPETLTMREFLLQLRRLTARVGSRMSEPKFLLEDAVVLGHSHNDMTVSQMFAAPLWTGGYWPTGQLTSL